MSTLAVAPRPEPTEDLMLVASSIPDQAKAIAITDQVSYEAAALFLTSVIVPMRARITETFGPIKKKAHEAHAEACEQERKHLSPVTDAEKIVKEKINLYATEQERIRQAEQRRLEEEARRREEEEREAQIELAEELGAPQEEIEALIQAPIEAPPVTAPVRVAPVSGVSMRENWKATVRDKMALIRYIVVHPELQNLLDVNQSAINQLARAQRGMLKLPGVTAFNDMVLSARGR